MSRDFDLGDILSVTTGILVSPRRMDGIYDILNYMTDDSLFTHQLPRAMAECREPMFTQHPELRAVSARGSSSPTSTFGHGWPSKKVPTVRRSPCGRLVLVAWGAMSIATRSKSWLTWSVPSACGSSVQTSSSHSRYYWEGGPLWTKSSSTSLKLPELVGVSASLWQVVLSAATVGAPAPLTTQRHAGRSVRPSIPTAGGGRCGWTAGDHQDQVEAQGPAVC